MLQAGRILHHAYTGNPDSTIRESILALQTRIHEKLTADLYGGAVAATVAERAAYARYFPVAGLGKPIKGNKSDRPKGNKKFEKDKPWPNNAPLPPPPGQRKPWQK